MTDVRWNFALLTGSRRWPGSARYPRTSWDIASSRFSIWFAFNNNYIHNKINTDSSRLCLRFLTYQSPRPIDFSLLVTTFWNNVYHITCTYFRKFCESSGIALERFFLLRYHCDLAWQRSSLRVSGRANIKKRWWKTSAITLGNQRVAWCLRQSYWNIFLLMNISSWNRWSFYVFQAICRYHWTNIHECVLCVWMYTFSIGGHWMLITDSIACLFTEIVYVAMY